MKRFGFFALVFSFAIGFSFSAQAALTGLNVYATGYTDYGGGLVAYDIWVDTGTGDPAGVPSGIELHWTAGGGGVINQQIAFGTPIDDEQTALVGLCTFDPGCDGTIDSWYALDGTGTDHWAGMVSLPVNTTVCPACTGTGWAVQGDGSLYTGMIQGGGNTAPADVFRIGQIVVSGGDGTLYAQGRAIQGADFLYSAWQFTPEPGTALLLGTGLIGLAIRRRKA